jgi:hypothetical protein
MQEACESRAASFETPPFHFCIDFKRLFMVYFFAVTAAATVPLSRSYAPFSLSLSLSHLEHRFNSRSITHIRSRVNYKARYLASRSLGFFGDARKLIRWISRLCAQTRKRFAAVEMIKSAFESRALFALAK